MVLSIEVFSLNIRSLHKNITDIRENLQQYNKFDVLCINECNCNAENLPFQGSELELEGFHPPFLQAPARASNRGGGLAIYVNKNFCELSDIQVKSDMSYRDDANTGEFQVIEIAINGHKNAILCNFYRSPSGNVQNFIDKLESVLQQLARHRNKNIMFF